MWILFHEMQESVTNGNVRVCFNPNRFCDCLEWRLNKHIVYGTHADGI